MVDRKEIEADRESRRFSYFLDDMVEQERITAFERQVVNQEAEAVARAAGQLDASGEVTSWIPTDSDAAVTRHENYLQRNKLLELHPELKDELERFINHRPYHPLPPVAGSLARPGAAVQQFQALGNYIDQKREEGVITHKDAYAMFDPAHRVLEDSGLHCGYLDRTSDPAAVAQAYQLMKKKLARTAPRPG